FSDLPGIYQMAKIFVYPSLYEGFGIPIIEALYSGVPVIAATGSCLEEAGGPCSLYTDPHNTDELAGLIDNVLSDPAKRASMIANGLKFVQQFNADRLSAELMEYYYQISAAS
ncbi:MAG: glycosyltransferase, partial [Pedobacter sp.]